MPRGFLEEADAARAPWPDRAVCVAADSERVIHPLVPQGPHGNAIRIMWAPGLAARGTGPRHRHWYRV